MIHLSQKLSAALDQAVCEQTGAPPRLPSQVTLCHDPRFGDYQSNIAMLTAKALGRPPRDLAQEIIARLRVEELCGKVEAAGAGFINFHLRDGLVARQLAAMAADPNGGIVPVEKPRRVVLDFSSPNIAKTMHVGHIRSTFLGDSLARVARAVGHHVITDNHLGDWGTNFGMLIHGYKHRLDRAALARAPIAEFERLYKEISAASRSDQTILEAARKELALLHAGDSENRRIWEEITALSLVEFNTAYQRLGVTFDHSLGESFYNPMLQGVVDELKRLGVARPSEGATCIFFPDDPALKDAAPMIIQKSDGAFLYATTDLATVIHRRQEWQAGEILYVTDARQQLHFKQLFAAVGKWAATKQLAGAEAMPELKHVVFGSILGSDKKPIKTRSGEPIKLTDLVDEAEARARKIIEERSPELRGDEQTQAARVIGIGALKYADLCQNRNLDYVFDWNKLLALQGNTAPYLIYAYVRIRSIFRLGVDGKSAGLEPPTASAAGRDGMPFHLDTPEELNLAKHLIHFSDTVHSILDDHRPHLLATYLYELAVRFSRFYEACPVLKAEPAVRDGRLRLCEITARTLKKGLHLLGIETVEKM